MNVFVCVLNANARCKSHKKLLEVGGYDFISRNIRIQIEIQKNSVGVFTCGRYDATIPTCCLIDYCFLGRNDDG